MGIFAAGQVVSFPFPYSNLTRNKYRPALLLASVGRGDWIVCQITSNPFADEQAILLTVADFSEGGLQRPSFVRTSKLLTAHELVFNAIEGTVNYDLLQRARTQLIALLTQAPPR